MKGVLAFVCSLSAAAVFAQPGMPSFCFVVAEDRDTLQPFQQGVRVIQHYRERIPYFGLNATYLGPDQELTLRGGPLFRDSTEQWMVHSPVHDVAEGQLRVIAGTDTMLIDLPEDERPWVDRAWRRWDRDTPEVIRFRKGRYSLNALISGAWADTAANALARRRIAEEDAAYRKELAELEEYYRNRPPPSPPPVPYTPPPPMTPEQWQAEMAKQPPLREARIIAVNGDTVTISFTGRVMLTGGCASNAPTFGIEQRTVSGWVEHFPLDLTQLDCGMPWADWEEHAVTIPLRWWVGNFAPPGRKELKEATYRMVFMGGNMKEMRTEPFTVE